MIQHIRFALLVALGAAALPAFAAGERLDDALRRCGKLANQTERLACFDSLVSTLPTLQEDRFGLTSDIKSKRDPVAAREEKRQVLPGRIVALRQMPHGEWVFTLDNQQVWKQAEPRRGMTFEVGEEVHIEHGALSSLWLAASGGRKVRVTRSQ